MARAIQRRCRTEGYVLHLEWQGADGLPNLIYWLKDRFEKQNGLCAISNTQMILQIGKKGSNKCSPDRKNSNLGYTPDNLWLVTSWVNFMKLDMPLIVFYSKIEAIHLARNKNITV
jgi:hypothetical protein